MNDIMNENAYPPASFGLHSSVQSKFLDFSNRKFASGVQFKAFDATKNAAIDVGRARNAFSSKVQDSQEQNFKIFGSDISNLSTDISSSFSSFHSNPAFLTNDFPFGAQNMAVHSRENEYFSNSREELMERLIDQCQENVQQEKERVRNEGGITPSSSMEFFIKKAAMEEEAEDFYSEDSEEDLLGGDENLVHMLVHLRSFIEKGKMEGISSSSSCSSPSSSSCSEEEESEGNQESEGEDYKQINYNEEMGQINIKYKFPSGEKESGIRKTTKSLNKSKLKQKRCSGACSEHKRRHQRCPMECPNRKRDELLASMSRSTEYLSEAI
eukprot:TRINITY_DN901_c0_g1_i4.p2 TRINITY_DN901_c0_g1~~TRINITY_DN901_c0_g1_i4.p2  ORF type:complete len:326 (-),score=151.49 TRINITY_DN901_c0_g1_i4:1809-2786(-)